MSSLVLELQQEALSKDTSVADLLRKALVVASKLGVIDFETLISAELKGYALEADLPAYRRINGTLKMEWVSTRIRSYFLSQR